MTARLRPLLALLCTLCLLGAQQAAYAHWIGHVGIAIGATAPDNGTGNDSDARGNACNSCTAFAALAAAPPAFVAPLAVAQAVAIPATETCSVYVPARPAPPYASRAPPAVL